MRSEFQNCSTGLGKLTAQLCYEFVLWIRLVKVVRPRLPVPDIRGLQVEKHKPCCRILRAGMQQGFGLEKPIQIMLRSAFIGFVLSRPQVQLLWMRRSVTEFVHANNPSAIGFIRSWRR